MASAHVAPSEPGPARMRQEIEALARAKSRQQAEEASRIYHPEIELVAPSLGARSVGSADTRRGLEQFFALFPDYEVELEHWTFGTARAACSGRVRMTPQASLLGLAGNGRRVELRCFIAFEFRDGKIAREEFFIDLASLCRQAGLSTDAVGQVLRAAAEAQR